MASDSWVVCACESVARIGWIGGSQTMEIGRRVVGRHVAAILLSSALAGCGGAPRLSDLDSDQRAHFGTMQILLAGAEVARAHVGIGYVEGLSCRRNLYDTTPPGENAAMQSLRVKAAEQRADAVINVACEYAKPDMRNNCWDAVVCGGDAVRWK
jgi:uncharacterized protein YbjQ (UPF0145 family)